MGLAIVADNAVEYLQSEIEAPTAFFDPVQRVKALQIVMKGPDSVFLTEFGKRPFPGMTEGTVTDIVPQSDGLDQILVETKGPTDRSTDFGKQLDMDDPPGDIVVFQKGKHLCLIDIACKRTGVKNTIGINGKRHSEIGLFPRIGPTTRSGGT